MSTYKQGDVVKVYWVDSVSHSGWGEFRDDGMNCESLGFFYEDREDSIVIYQSHLLEWSVSSKSTEKTISNRADYLQIPKVAITKIVKLVEAQ